MKASPNHYPSLLGSILFILGALFLLGIGLFIGVTALASIFTGAEVRAEQTILVVAFGFEALLLLSASFFTIHKFLQKPSADEQTVLSLATWQIAGLGFVAGVSLLIGYLVDGIKAIHWIVFPLLAIPAIVFPIAVLLAFSTRKLPLGTRWQTWTVLGLSMTLAPILLFIFEIFVGLFILVFIVAYIFTQPELALELQSLLQQVMILGPESEAARELMIPLLTNPAVVAVALIYIGVLVPAIEETIKPIGVWLFAGKLNAAQGFTLGALSGAGYALIETIGVSGQTIEWASTLTSRIGTGLLHITTSALMGAAIVMAWRERRYLRFIGTYVLAILLHGLWNSIAVFFAFSTIAELFGQAGPLSTIQPAMIVSLAVLAIVLFVILVISNLRMRKPVLSTTQSTIPSENDRN
ncbi:MAG: PrsW family glutamic-type intramembrane protease [Anaerolineales bacterium]